MDDRTSRIKEMEDRLNRIIEWNTHPSDDSVRDDVRILEEYYHGPLWKSDFEADEAGMLPADLRRGVLSEDAVYNALAEYEEKANKGSYHTDMSFRARRESGDKVPERTGHMETYKHTVQYYETDKMGITHHSNYIRWMEEARIDFLRRIGWDYARLEQEGIISPVVEVSCRYKKSTTFADDVFIAVSVKEFRGVKLILSYDMRNAAGSSVAEGESVHCFINESGKPVRLAKEFPEFFNVLMDLSGTE